MLGSLKVAYKNDHVGRKAYLPKVLMRIILYAYYRGITSRRVIARCAGPILKSWHWPAVTLRTTTRKPISSVVNLKRSS